MKSLSKTLAIMAMAIGVLSSCGNTTKHSPNNRNYETGYSSESTVTTEEESPYIDNSFQPWDVPYDNEECIGWRFN